MYFITTKRMLEVCFFQHTPTFIIEPIFFFIFDPLHVNLYRKKRRFHFFVNRRIFSIIFPVLLPGVRGQGACGYLPHTEYRYKASQGLFRSGYKVLPSLPEVLRGSDPPHT